MKVFKDKPWEGAQGSKLRISDLCPTCRSKFKIHLKGMQNGESMGELPGACDKCKKLMEYKMKASRGHRG